MKRLETGFINRIGENEYPIILWVREEGEYIKTPADSCEYTDTGVFFDPKKFDLWCEKEIYAPAWYQILLDSVDKYVRGELN